MKYFFPNLSFEDELADRPPKTSPATREALNDLAPLLGLLAKDDDVVVLDELPKPAELPDCLKHVRFQKAKFLQQLTIGQVIHCVPWGWTNAIRDTAVNLAMSGSDIPADAAVRLVNSRSFSAVHDRVISECDERLPFGSDHFGILCENMDALLAGVDRLQQFGYDRWVAKPQISHAGRNRLLSNGHQLNDQQRGWLRKQLQQSGGVYLEPWVIPIDECGLQFQIDAPTAGSQVRFMGVTQLINDHVGRYRGSLVCGKTLLENVWAEAVEHGHSVCRAAAQSGYFGPLGIDAFRFRLRDGNTAIRPCNDVNARFTMGRLALQLRSLLQPGESGLWCQFATTNYAELLAAAENILAFPAYRDVRTVATSPREVAGRPVRLGTLYLTGPTSDQLLEVDKKLRSRPVSTTEISSEGHLPPSGGTVRPVHSDCLSGRHLDIRGSRIRGGR